MATITFAPPFDAISASEAAAVTFTVSGLTAPTDTWTANFIDSASTLVAVSGTGEGPSTADLSGLIDGTITSTIESFDGGVSRGSPEPGSSVQLDSAPPSRPTLDDFADDTGPSGTDGITSDTTLVIIGTAEANATVTLRNGGTPIGAAVTADADGDWTFTTSALAAGAYAFTAVATDGAGNASIASVALNVTVDTTPPAAPTITGLAVDTGTSATDRITSDDELTLTGTAEAGAAIAIRAGSVTIGSGVADGSGVWTVTTSNLADGPRNLRALATDAAGNASALSAPLQVTIDTAAPSAPAITGVAGNGVALAAGGFTSDNTPTITGTGEAGAVVTVRDADDDPVGSADVAGNGTWTLTTSVLPDGLASFTAVATDAAGGASVASAARSVTVDTAPPPAPTITGFADDDGAATDDGVTSDTTLTITGTATGAPVTVTVLAADGDVIGSTIITSNGPWTVTTPALAIGGYALTAVSTDSVGNASAASAALAVTVVGEERQVEDFAAELPSFDLEFYAAEYPDIVAADVDPVRHYDEFGWREGRDPNPIFITNGYFSANGDVSAADINPLAHYQEFGWLEGRDPSANFDTTLYLLNNPDVAAAGLNPLDHYLRFGAAEGRETYAAVGGAIEGGFDDEAYLLANPDVGRAGIDAALHYDLLGWREGRNPNAYFDTVSYLATNADVDAADINPLRHYVEFGAAEGRDAGPAFNTAAYLQNSPDVAAAGINPLQHYLEFGIYEGRDLG